MNEQQLHEYISPKLEVRRCAEKGGLGVFARELVKAGELLVVWGGVITPRDRFERLPPATRRYSIQVEEDLFLVPGWEPEAPAFVNHSCDPNAGMSGQIALVAMRDIAPGEEVCYDYAMSDGSPYDEFACSCGTSICRGRVTGDDWRRPELWERYAGYFSPYLQRRIDRLRGCEATVAPRRITPVKEHADHPGVVVLYNHSRRLIKGDPRDFLAEKGVIACAHAVAAALEAAGYEVAIVPMDCDLELTLSPYPPTRWMVFNLGEGLEGRLFEEARIAWALEAMGYRFTGSDGQAIANSAHKARAKELLRAAGIPTPPWVVFRDPAEVTSDRLDGLPFPVMVKPIAEDASLGIGREAVVHDAEQLRNRVEYVVECYRQAALAETFIPGREFNVALWGEGPDVLPLAEVDFSAFHDPFARIVSFAAKWEPQSFEYLHTPVCCPASVEPGLAARIADTARRAWCAIGCHGYARVDMRVSADGKPYVVEVNCNPDLSPDAGFYRAAQAAGYDYPGMVTHILELALVGQQAYDRDSRRARRSSNSRLDNGRWPVQAGGDSLRGGAVARVSGAG